MNAIVFEPNPVAEGIVKTLNYFGLFQHPLTTGEIHRFHPLKCTPEEIGKHISEMEESGLIHKSEEGYYSLGANPDWSVQRMTANKKAAILLKRSVKFTSIIRSFPFVVAIAVSGSLSKYVAGPQADIDYFIITARNRLWITRTLLHLFKKLTFIPRYQHCFCMNYFLDQGHPEIPDQNLYTAVELSTLIPVYNLREFVTLKKVNPWVDDFLPNEPGIPDERYLVEMSKQPFTRMVEWMFNRLWPEKLNSFLMRLTDRKWRRKWTRRGFPMEDYDQAFQTTLYISKNHPANFQKRILNALNKKTYI